MLRRVERLGGVAKERAEAERSRRRLAILDEARQNERRFQRCMELSFLAMPKVAREDPKVFGTLMAQASERCWKSSNCDFNEAQGVPHPCSIEYNPE